ncbi:DUF6264 family protein [Agromyces mediolanus]|uniref:DUF6264 family protein n=1 Tax=Agromyces mediolanus TaxID=41986 RepID=UPI003836D07C
MTNDEAARPDASEPGPPTPPPSDERPRPRYGEYAPPGWSWQPPEQADAAAPAEPARAEPAPPPQQAAPADAPAAPAKRAPGWDRILTIGLLAFGAFGAWNSAASLQEIPRQMQLSYDMMGVGTFTPPEWLPTLSLIGTIVQLALYAVVLGLSVLRLRAGRLAFWIPLAGGAASFIVTLVLLSIVMLNDPTYVDFVTGVTSPSPTPAP